MYMKSIMSEGDNITRFDIIINFVTLHDHNINVKGSNIKRYTKYCTAGHFYKVLFFMFFTSSKSLSIFKPEKIVKKKR